MNLANSLIRQCVLAVAIGSLIGLTGCCDQLMPGAGAKAAVAAAKPAGNAVDPAGAVAGTITTTKDAAVTTTKDAAGTSTTTKDAAGTTEAEDATAGGTSQNTQADTSQKLDPEESNGQSEQIPKITTEEL